jgi:hypothetical protein
MSIDVGDERQWLLDRLSSAGLLPIPLPKEREDPPFPPPSDAEKLRVRRLVLDQEHVDRVAFSAVVRRVPHDTYKYLLVGSVRPRAGDLVLARITRLGHHSKLEHPSGRRRPLETGMEVVLACGNRYATDQFEAFVPPRLGPAHLVAAGGIAGIVTHRARGVSRPTEIDILGVFCTEDGIPLNLSEFALPPVRGLKGRPPVLAVFGTSMNAGKTTASRFVARGLVRAGFRVGYAKVTGTGSGGDRWAIRDEGAHMVLDFTDAGLASTYQTPIPVIEQTLVRLVGHLTLNGCDRIVLEFADGLFQDGGAADVEGGAPGRGPSDLRGRGFYGRRGGIEHACGAWVHGRRDSGARHRFSVALAGGDQGGSIPCLDGRGVVASCDRCRACGPRAHEGPSPRGGR